MKAPKSDPQTRYVEVKGKISQSWENIPAIPLDFSFKELANVKAIVDEEPRAGTKSKDMRVQKEEKILGADGKFIEVKQVQKQRCNAIRLSNNKLSDLSEFDQAVKDVIDDSQWLSWIDLSFNHLTSIDPILTTYRDLTTLYLHANEITRLSEIDHLANLPKLHTLTLHGNPMENIRGYRKYVLHKLPGLRHLDFCAVTKAERAIARRQGMSSVGGKHEDQ